MPQSLYKRGKKSGVRSEHDDIWDDTLLIKAYDESVRLQKEEVAKQLAMKTNKVQKSDEEPEEAQTSESSSSSEVYKVGDFVRSTFADDGVDYEAEVLKVTESGMCSIRYIGYGNEERVKAENLVASWGPEARDEQRILAEADQHVSSDKDDHQEELHKFVLNKSQSFRNSLPIPPMPPMPPAMFDNTRDSEYMSAMLMSWYMSGYYTGLYHGRKQASEELQAKQNSNLKQEATERETPSKKKKTRRH